MILFYRHHIRIEEELLEFTQSKVGLTFGIFLAIISVAFLAETNNSTVITVSAGLTTIAIVSILVSIIQRNKNQKYKSILKEPILH